MRGQNPDAHDKMGDGGKRVSHLKEELSGMKYRELIRPELRRIARVVPYNRAMIALANAFLPMAFRMARVPKGIVNRRIAIDGCDGRKLKVDVFEPSRAGEALPCLLYVHGGAFSYKASAHHKKLACRYAAEVGCRVYFPDYPLLPRHPHPAAYQDVLALYGYILKNARALGIDDARIGVAGDSAGGTIAALVCNHCEAEHLKPPRVQMLIYPATDASMRTESMRRFADTPLWNAKNNARMWSYYCGAPESEKRRAASPMRDDLPREIPDTYIETAEYDCLHDEGVMYGRRLQSSGARVEINETRGTFHGYDAALNADIALQNIQRRVDFLREGFCGE